ncbi:hypothetical protein HK405_011584, partial [Cladochytrium tenue]
MADLADAAPAPAPAAAADPLLPPRPSTPLSAAIAASAAAGVFGSTAHGLGAGSGTPPPPGSPAAQPRLRGTPPPTKARSLSVSAGPALSPGTAAERIASLNERFAASIRWAGIVASSGVWVRHSQRKPSHDRAPTRALSGTFGNKKLPPSPPSISEEDSMEQDEIALISKALSARVESLAKAPQPPTSCPCCLVIDADDPTVCRYCNGTFVEVVRLGLDRDLARDILAEQRRKLEDLNEKEEAARQDAAKLGEKVTDLEKLMDSKAEEQARLQMDLQRMGEKIIEEIEKRAELQVSRDTLQDELEELTKSLFEEANVMVADEARKRHHHETREKTLEQELAELKQQLQMEQLQLRELQIKMEETQASASLRKRPAGGSSSNLSLAGSRPASQSFPNLAADDVIDSALFAEFEDFVRQAPMVKLNKLHTLPFMKSAIDDDVTPCLRFGGNPRTSTKKLVDAILMNSCFVEDMSPAQVAQLQFQYQCIRDASEPASPGAGAVAAAAAAAANSGAAARRASHLDPDKVNAMAALAAAVSAPTQAIFQKTVLERLSSTWTLATAGAAAAPSLPPSVVVDGCSACGRVGGPPTRHHFKISEQADDAWCPVCAACRDRLVAAAEFCNLVRHVRQGLYSTRRREDLFREVLALKRKMFFARAGATALLVAERPLLPRGAGLLRPDSQLLRDLEVVSSATSASASSAAVGATATAGLPPRPAGSLNAALRRINEDPPLYAAAAAPPAAATAP